MELKVEVKQAGSRTNSIKKTALLLQSSPRTVRELITDTVKATYADFYEKNKSSKAISEQEAVDIALQSFLDGLVVIFIDKKRYENLETDLNLTGEETLTFVKLTMLSGSII